MTNEHLEFIRKSDWIYLDNVKYRILLGYENNPLLTKNNKWATWEESWMFKDEHNISKPYRVNCYWGHYNMSKTDALTDYYLRLLKLEKLTI